MKVFYTFTVSDPPSQEPPKEVLDVMFYDAGVHTLEQVENEFFQMFLARIRQYKVPKMVSLFRPPDDFEHGLELWLSAQFPDRAHLLAEIRQEELSEEQVQGRTLEPPGEKAGVPSFRTDWPEGTSVLSNKKGTPDEFYDSLERFLKGELD